MKQNCIFWTGIINSNHNDKYGNYDYLEYSKKSWQYFCKRFNCIFVEFSKPVEEDLIEYRVNWQKAIFVFDELDRLGIEYDQIALVDSTCMCKWDCPNFFELTEHKFTAWRDLDNMKWIYDSVQGYQEFFTGFKLDTTKYINSGFMIFNEFHKEFFNTFKLLYKKNKDEFIKLQDTIVKKGNEQTPLNYWLQIWGIDVKIDLPIAFKLTHLHRKELFSYNWQQSDSDKLPFFIKYGYNWIFNGIPKNDRSVVMKQVWELVKHNYNDKYLVLDKVQHKDTVKNSTTRKFKKDLIDYFSMHELGKCIEFGCSEGNTTRILAEYASIVYASDINPLCRNLTQTICKNNINVKTKIFDVNSSWAEFPIVDTIYLDALHDEVGIRNGLSRIKIQQPIAAIIMDDYGHEMGTVKTVIDELISKNEIEILKWIGEEKGYRAANDKIFVDREGLIFKFI